MAEKRHLAATVLRDNVSEGDVAIHDVSVGKCVCVCYQMGILTVVP